MFRTLAKLTLILTALAARSESCALVWVPVPVRPDFQVFVQDRGGPVGGLPVVIVGIGHRFETNTDKHGLAVFRKVPPGTYQVNVNHNIGDPLGNAIQVKSDGPVDFTLPIQWPSGGPVAARSLKGILHGPASSQPQPKLFLDLENSSGQKLKSLETTETSEFNFEGVKPGVYFILLNPSGMKGWSGEEMTGPIAVAVEKDASTDHLDIDLAWTSCGLVYRDHSK